MFEWISFLEANRVHYVTTGPNVSRGNVAVHCPFCGGADKSQHMSISLKDKGWRCLRVPDQRGKSPVYLVQALLQTTLERAKEIVGTAVFIPDDFMGAVMSKMNPEHPDDVKHELELPASFKTLEPRPSAKHFINYLAGRGFSPRAIRHMTRDYDIHYATHGPMKGRVIFPVYYKRELKTWTGRSIYPDAKLRYLTLSADREEEKHPAAGPINDYLLWYDDIMAADPSFHTLLFCEGPFDALKTSCLGARHGITSTCFFTAAPSLRQIDMVAKLVKRFPKSYLLLDAGTIGTALRVQSAMSALRIPFLKVPDNIKDPGDLDERSLLKIIP